MLRPITRRQSGLLPTIRREVPAAEGQLFTRTFDDTARTEDEPVKTLHKMIDDLLCRTV